ncbi:phosphopantetheine-binding protein [Streptomyces paludis]|uniref:phosphopantetheine-binding protein n=1 Tax=Streptomyces paludis TaxID=2282738 RepID=UPI0013B47499|nr:phosphopantetheine-binding protein [Streptomyces paludis]
MSDKALAVRRRIRGLLIDLFGNDRLVGNVSDAESLRQAGISSTALVSLLVAMEDAFGFEWDEDVRPEALRSIESLADHVVSLR